MCGKICKNEKGLKIHQSMMKCKERQQASQCAGQAPGETEEELSPEAPRRAQSLQVVQTVHSTRQSRKRRIRWPQASKTAEWQKFDEDADKVLEATAKGDVERRLLRGLVLRRKGELSSLTPRTGQLKSTTSGKN